MPLLTVPSAGMQTFCEMEELAGLPSSAQRYIRRSLSVFLGRWQQLAEMTRCEAEAKSIERQVELYRQLDSIRAAIPSSNDPYAAAVHFTTLAAQLVVFDLAQQKIRCFASFRFLYERLLGAAARPWLLAVFVMAASTAPISSALRTALLSSIGHEATSGPGPTVEPLFVPQWVDRLDG